MNNKDASQEEIVGELLEFLNVSPDANQRFLKVKEVFQVQFHLPEIDFVRNEIGKSYAIAAYHGMITLTNLLLERYCKLTLIYKFTGFRSIQDLKNLAEDFKPAMKRYNKMSLGETLQECLNEGIIDEATYVFFLDMKNRFRDGFGHADAAKILKGQTGRFALGSFNDLSVSEVQTLTFQNIPPLHGIAVQQFASENAWGYFVSVENLIRSTLKHYINDHFEVDIEMVNVLT
ncbi:MAG TPA: hypothetical protein VF622_01685 [Segetibacter sp.]|jgi:hypothetical protein